MYERKDKMTDKLKPCPFCGGDGKLEEHTDYSYIDRKRLITFYNPMCSNKDKLDNFGKPLCKIAPFSSFLSKEEAIRLEII